MKKIIAILLAMLTVISMAVAEEPATAGNIGPVPDAGKLPSGWYLSSDYEMGMYWDNDLGQWTDWHYHNDACEYVHLKSGIKKNGTGTKYMDAYCDICDGQIRAVHKHTYVTTIKEGALMNGIYKGHWYIDTCVCEYCNDVSLQFERHSEDVIDWTDEDGTYHKRTFCYLCGYEVEEVIPADTEAATVEAEEPAETKMYAYESSAKATGWYSYRYSYGYYWDDDLEEYSNYHSHDDAESYIQIKGEVKEDMFGEPYCEAYCTICNKEIYAGHAHTYIYDIEESSILNGMVQGHWTIKKCTRSNCNKEERVFEPHDVNEYCSICGYEPEPAVTFAEAQTEAEEPAETEEQTETEAQTETEEPAETGMGKAPVPVEGWYSESYSCGYYQHKDGSRTDYHSHEEDAENITVSGKAKEDWVGDYYVNAYCSICKDNVKAKHTHNWKTEVLSTAIMNGIVEGHRFIYTCTDDYCGKTETTFEPHEITEVTWVDTEGNWQLRKTCSSCDWCYEETCNHHSTMSWREEDCYGSWYCDYCGTRVGELVYVGPSTPMPSGYVGLNIPMLIRNNPNTLYTGTFSASDYCFIAPWSSMMIRVNNITTFDGLKYYQTNEYGTVIVELLDSKTGAVAFAHVEDVLGFEDLIPEGEEITFDGIEPITVSGEWINLPDFLFRIYDENCEHDWQMIYYRDEYSGNFTMYYKCSKCNSTQRYFSIFA